MFPEYTGKETIPHARSSPRKATTNTLYIFIIQLQVLGSILVFTSAGNISWSDSHADHHCTVAREESPRRWDG